jgi:DNA-binding response OmpR family regulator
LARILIIEDRKLITDVYAVVLKGAGHTVIPATSGGEGLALFRKDPPDVVMVDVNLPDGCGLALMRVMQTERDTPIIVLTGGGKNADGDYIDTALRQGAAAAYLKPIPADVLRAAVENALKSRAA